MSLSFEMAEKDASKLLKVVPQTKLAGMLESLPEELTSSDESEDDDTEISGIETNSEAEYSQDELTFDENNSEADKIESEMKTIKIYKMPLNELPMEAKLPLVKLENFIRGNQLCCDTKAWQEFEQKKRIRTVSRVHDSIKLRSMTNVKIKVGETIFDCHYLLLICYSTYFMMRMRNKREYTLPKDQVTPTAFAIIYEWMLNEDAQVKREHILEVLNASRYLGIEDLKNQVWCCLESKEYFFELEAFLLFLEAKEMPSMSCIQGGMLQRISKFFMILLTTKEFFDLSAEHVAILLSSDSIAVNTENEVFYAAILWLNHDWPARQAHAEQVLKSVRMTSLPGPFLISLRRPTRFKRINQITKTASFKELLTESIFRQTLIKYNDGGETFTKICNEFNVVKPEPRVFFYDKTCSYHKLESDEDESAVPDFAQFIDYLYMLRLSGAGN